MSGAFILSNAESINNTNTVDRPLPYEELSERLNTRKQHNFIIWDGKIRVSAAGFQDKIGVKMTDGRLSLPEGFFNHTSHILKPPPINNQFESMVVNENFLQWIAFQLCIGNVDAHAKNLSFFINSNGKTQLAPFYDQVCILELGQKSERNSNELELNMAMAIGDEFDIKKIGAYDIALMAKEAGFPVKSVITSFTKIAKLVLEHVDNVEAKDYYQHHDSIKQIICQLSEQLLDSLQLVNEAYQDL